MISENSMQVGVQLIRKKKLIWKSKSGTEIFVGNVCNSNNQSARLNKIVVLGDNASTLNITWWIANDNTNSQYIMGERRRSRIRHEELRGEGSRRGKTEKDRLRWC